MINQTATLGGKALIDGQFVDGTGDEFESLCPVDNHVVWSGRASDAAQIDSAFGAARSAFGLWWNLGADRRIEIVTAYANRVKEKANELALLISRETGKPVWESKTEVGAVVGKAAVSVDSFRERRDTSSFEMGAVNAVTRFKPHGVLGVLGPFNFPAHLANGHIVPALIAGNTVVFKPSEQSPAVSDWLMQQWMEAGLPPGVINMVHGAREVGQAITNHPELDGLLFTGSSGAGTAINKALADQPHKIVALEMGGNNALIVHGAADNKAAAYLTILSAYFTAGQRCTCARRLIVVDNEETKAFIAELVAMIGRIKIGFYNDEPEPFMGTVISREQGRRILAAQDELVAAGAISIVTMQSHRGCDALISPGLIDVTDMEARRDHELFGPLLSLIRVPDFDAAIDEANNTRYGLSAALLSNDRACYETFIHRIRAGIVNWNRQTTGATGRLPFGGCGLSGNNRPSAYFAADYCSWPVASLEADTLELPESTVQGIDVG